MSGNFWHSTHCTKWLLPAETLAAARTAAEASAGFTRDELLLLESQFAHLVSTVGRKLKLPREVIATACVYLKRFYGGPRAPSQAYRSFRDYDPLLLVPTCLYLASKVEECAVRVGHVLAALHRVLRTEHYAAVYPEPQRRRKRARGAQNTPSPSPPPPSAATRVAAAAPLLPVGLLPLFPFTIADVLLCEFHVLEALEFDLLVFHPYRPLAQYLRDSASVGGDAAKPAASLVAAPTRTASAASLAATPAASVREAITAGASSVATSVSPAACLQLAWSLCNDSYRTDACLRYPPHMIALGCVYLSCVLRRVAWRSWFDRLNVSTAELRSVASTLLSHYELHAASGSEAVLRRAGVKLRRVVPGGPV